MAEPDSPPPMAAFRGPVACRRTPNGLTLSGAAARGDETLIVTLLDPRGPELPESLTAAVVRACGGRGYRIMAAPQEWSLEATSVHVHHDIREAFYRAIPPRPVPLQKRVFWRVVLALAGTRAGKRLLLSLRRRG